MITFSLADVRRFWAKVDRSGGRNACWPWTAGRMWKGYGHFGLWLKRKKKCKTFRTNRVVFFLKHGRWPRPFALHTCDFPPCCNPRHVVEGNAAANSRDMAKKGRGRTTPICGEANLNAKLTARAVKAIRTAYARGVVTQEALARRYGVTQGHVSAIILGKAWRRRLPRGLDNPPSER